MVAQVGSPDDPQDGLVAAIYQHIADCLGCPNQPNQYGLTIAYEPTHIHLGDLMYLHCMVVRDGGIYLERHALQGDKQERTDTLGHLDLADPTSLDFHSIRRLAGMS